MLGTSGSTARVRTLWDAGHIYVYAEVTDALLSKASANPWEQDSIEVFLDQNNGKTTTYEADDAQYRVNYENTRASAGRAAPPASSPPPAWCPAATWWKRPSRSPRGPGRARSWASTSR